MTDTRSLTSGEVALAQSVYGDSINYSNVTITLSNNVFSNAARTLSQDIAVGKGFYSKDYSLEESSDKFGRMADFIHEMSHVRDFQKSGVSNLSRGPARDYDYRDKLANGVNDIDKYTIEERASLFEDIFKQNVGIKTKTIPFTNKTVLIPEFVIVGDLVIGPPVDLLAPQECFPASTPILLPGGASLPIESLAVGDTVLAFASGTTALTPARVTRLYPNVTDEWIELNWRDPTTGEPRSLTATPGHVMATPEGGFGQLGQMIIPPSVRDADISPSRAGESHMAFLGLHGSE